MIAAAGMVMQVALGAVYAWSAFRIPLSENYGTMASAVNTTTEAYVMAMFLAGLMLVSSHVPFIVRPPKAPEEAEAGGTAKARA